ncbi:helix-turn-helix domain-containing protein [Cysteiniphilum halobium]|uniref:helix-turn-helix domain-containing protein n=1 Tax=Cysteiniphilum halobium TaxID=2219059 RepID=UPI000E64B2ED|nr:helix-turn-helix domain-containing protein [Cysteiniphilum halobium]
MGKKALTDKELNLIKNVSDKLQAYMDINNLSLYGLTSKFGFEYQPVHRLMKGEALPKVSSLAMISDCLGCSIEQLIDDKIEVNALLYDDKNILLDAGKTSYADIRISLADYKSNLYPKLFAVKENRIESINASLYKLYANCDSILIDGLYLANYKHKLVEFDVISTSTKFIITKSSGQESRILQKDLKAVGKYIKDIIIFDNQHNFTILQGVKK